MQNLFFLNEGHQTHITRRNVTPDLSGEGCLYNKLGADLMFRKPWASKNRAPSLLHQVLSWLWVLAMGVPLSVPVRRTAPLQFDLDELHQALQL